MKLLYFLFLFCLLLFSGCKDEVCPPFPDDQLVWLPTLEVGNVVVYSNGEELLEFTVESFEKDKGGTNISKCACDNYATIKMRCGEFLLINQVFYIECSNLILMYIEHELYESYTCSFDYDYNSQEYVIYSNITIQEIEKIEIAGASYNDVLQIDRKESTDYKKSIYYAKSYGIIRFETADGEVWDLVKFK